MRIAYLLSLVAGAAVRAVAYRTDLMAVADAVGVTETTPLYDQLRRERVQDAADTRLDLYGDCDFDEWSREVAQP